LRYNIFFLSTAWSGAFSDGDDGLDDEDEYNKKSEVQGIIHIRSKQFPEMLPSFSLPVH
jgi:hypothetical protein